jgi:hypothetical protein
MVAEGHLDAALVIMPIGDHKLFVHRIRTQRVLVLQGKRAVSRKVPNT